MWSASPKTPEHGTIHLRDQLFDRRRAELVALPLPAADSAVKHHRARDVISFRRQQHRLPTGLANTDDANPRAVDFL